MIGVTSVKRKQKIVVSLTSYPARIDTVWLTIETLLRQSMKPDELILWLADEQFPSKDLLPKKLISQTKEDCKLNFVIRI